MPLLDFGRIDSGIMLEDLRTQELYYNYQAHRSMEPSRKWTIPPSPATPPSETASNQLARRRRRQQTCRHLATGRYDRGLIDFLNVLDAQRQLYTLQDQYTVAQQSVVLQYIALYKALGGGWGALSSKSPTSNCPSPPSSPPPPNSSASTPTPPATRRMCPCKNRGNIPIDLLTAFFRLSLQNFNCNCNRKHDLARIGQLQRPRIGIRRLRRVIHIRQNLGIVAEQIIVQPQCIKFSDVRIPFIQQIAYAAQHLQPLRNDHVAHLPVISGLEKGALSGGIGQPAVDGPAERIRVDLLKVSRRVDRQPPPLRRPVQRGPENIPCYA